MSRDVASARALRELHVIPTGPLIAFLRCPLPVTLARTALLFCAVSLVSGTASSSPESGNPLNSSEKPSTATPDSARPQGHDEFTIVPVAGGTTDIGIGGGFFAGLTRNQADRTPYVWDIQSAGFLSFLVKDGKVVFPYTDIYSKITITRFLGGPLQLEVRPSFTDELALDYYGMGDASSAAVPRGRTTDYFEYARLHPEILSDVRFKLVDHVAGRVGLRYVETWFDVPANSKLGEDIRNGSPEIQALIGTTKPAGAALFRYGLQFDNRDNEVSPHRGTFDEVALNWSPGGTPELPFRYGEASVNLRGYAPLFSRRVTLAVRIVGDVLFGNVPFYELSRAVDTYAIGGSNGVRGVPAQRYYGKVKAFGNVEVRARLFDFRLFKKSLALGAAAFFDSGRVWADTSPHPELDGTGLGLKYGVGGGLRLMSGSAFVLRADIAWSPDATPIGGYVVAGESF